MSKKIHNQGKIKKDPVSALKNQKAAILVYKDKFGSENFNTTNDLLKPVIAVWKKNIKDDDWNDNLQPKEFVDMAIAFVRIRQASAELPDAFKPDVKEKVASRKGEISVSESTKKQFELEGLAKEFADFAKKDGFCAVRGLVIHDQNFVVDFFLCQSSM